MPRNSGMAKVIVAGGGIGGLAAALGLARKGCRVSVLEQAEVFGEIGAGIQIGPNAFHALDHLGAGDGARARAVYIDRLVMMDASSGQMVAAIPWTAPSARGSRTLMPSSTAPTFTTCCWRLAAPTPTSNF